MLSRRATPSRERRRPGELPKATCSSGMFCHVIMNRNIVTLCNKLTLCGVLVLFLVLFVERLMAHEVRYVVERTDRQTHMTTTVTLAPHARRGLKIGDK